MDLIGTEMIVGKHEGEGIPLSLGRLILEGTVIGMARRRLMLERVVLQRKGQQ